jgi:hypothetical protein
VTMLVLSVFACVSFLTNGVKLGNIDPRATSYSLCSVGERVVVSVCYI